MASDAYLNLIKEIPKDIQKDVIGSINIANEISLVLKSKNLTSADLARMMNKSESEISKWMTGLHNFTFKTIRKIEEALEADLIVTKSSLIEKYELEINRLNKEVKRLQNEIDVDLFSKLIFQGKPSNTFKSHAMSENFEFGSFIPKESLVKIKPETSSELTFQLYGFVNNDC